VRTRDTIDRRRGKSARDAKGKKPQTFADLALELFGRKHGVELEPHPPVEARPASFRPSAKR